MEQDNQKEEKPSDRLVEARKELEKSRKEFAEYLKLNVRYYGQLELGYYNLTLDHLLALHKKYDISPNYILLGQPPKFLNEQTNTASAQEEQTNYNPMTEEERKLLNTLAALMEKVIARLEALEARDKKEKE